MLGKTREKSRKRKQKGDGISFHLRIKIISIRQQRHGCAYIMTEQDAYASNRKLSTGTPSRCRRRMLVFCEIQS
jgi:hypothetical protein